MWFEERGPRRFSLLYLYAEGVLTYRKLYWRNNISPEVLVIIRAGHAFGWNNTDFTDPRGLLSWTVQNNNSASIPEYLVCEGRGHDYTQSGSGRTIIQFTLSGLKRSLASGFGNTEAKGRRYDISDKDTQSVAVGAATLASPRTDPGVRLSRTGLLSRVKHDGVRGLGVPYSSDPEGATSVTYFFPAPCPGARVVARLPPTGRLPSPLSAAAHRSALFGASPVLRSLSDFSPVHRQLRLLDFLSRSGTASAARPGDISQVPTRSF